MHRDGKDIWLFFGESLPTGGRSHNHYTGGRERGVSVYSVSEYLEEAEDGEDWVGAPRNQPAAEYLNALMKSRPAWLVSGRQVGTGHDGEPVIRSARIIRRLVPRGQEGSVVWFAVQDETPPKHLRRR